MAGPIRGEDSLGLSRSMQLAEQSLSQMREQNEKKLNDIKIKYLNQLFKTSEKGQKELHKLDVDLAKKSNDYRTQLMQKYSERYGQEAIKNGQLDKKIAKEVLNYIEVQKQGRREEEKKQELQLISDAKTAKIKADIEIYKKKIELIKKEASISLEKIDTQRRKNLAALKSGRKTREAYRKQQKKLDARDDKKRQQLAKKLTKKGASHKEILQAQAEGRDRSRTTGVAYRAELELNAMESLGNVVNGLLNNMKQMFEQTIQTYGQYQQKINTRLQGSGLYWNGSGGIESTIKTAIGNNPFVKLQTVMDNVVKATEQGIAFDIEQRAFLETVKEGIATTFDAFDSNLSRIIRMQQADTTAARLGLEAGLTNFFNNMYKDTSYLNSAFDTVSQNLIETTSQLSAESAVELEYVIQKWLGSLYSVGFSDTAVGKISQALGYLGSGNISALASDTEMQNLIVMAASRANMSYSDMLIDGLDASSTNKLMRSMVGYLEEIANSDNKVVKSEYAKIFGMTVSDLKAVSNIGSDIGNITNSMMSYGGAVSELYSQMGELSGRISIAGKMQNLLDNAKYSIATGIAGNPATYALWEITSLIEDLTGGIALPTVSVLGNMVDLNTTVTNLMRAGIVGVGSLGAIGSAISGLSSTFSPASMLSKLGIAKGSNAKTTGRGAGLSRKARQALAQSSSVYIGNTSGEDYYKASITAAESDSDKMAKQKQAESKDVTLNNIHEYLLSVFDPKLTEIEKLVALMAGYEVKESAWTGSSYGHVFGEGKQYTATTAVAVGYGDSQTRVNSTSLLSNINENTAQILKILQDATDGVKTIKISDGTMFPGAGNNGNTGAVTP